MHRYIRLAQYARFILIHDSGERTDKLHYHYKDIYPLFKYRYAFEKVRPHTTVLSNFVDLAEMAYAD